MFFVDGRESPEKKRKIEPIHIEPALYPGFFDIFVAKNNIIRERLDAQSFEYDGIDVSVCKISQKISVRLTVNQSVFIIRSSDLSHIFG